MTARQTPPTDDPRPSVPALPAEPAVGLPLKAVLRSWAARDPLEAAEDAGWLALAPERVADERCVLAWTAVRPASSRGDP